MQTSPPDTETILARLREMLPELRERYGVQSVAIFGSYARGEQTAESDLDVLVDFDPVPGYLTFIGLETFLSESLRLKVEMATRPMIGPRLAPGVQRDLMSV